jgi:1,4-dihydroxy-2-naphthoyl-CoA hydrolase
MASTDAAIDPADLPVAPLNELLGMRLEHVDAERVVVSLPVRPELHQPFGIVHGGVYCSMVETAVSYGAAVAAGGDLVVGVSNHTDFLRATREGVLRGEARRVHLGRTMQLWEVAITDDEDRLVAHGKVRLMRLAAEGAATG